MAEDAAMGTVVYHLVALDPDVESSELLDYAATEPITAVDKDGKEVGLCTRITSKIYNSNVLFSRNANCRSPTRTNSRTGFTLTAPAR